MGESQARSEYARLELEEAPQGIARLRNWLNGSPLRIPLLYLAFLALAETVTALVDPRLGLVLHGICLVSLVLHAVIFSQGREQSFLLGLSLSPLIRLLSLTMPLPQFALVNWYMVVGLPLFLASFILMRITNLNGQKVGLTARAPIFQLLGGFTGVGLGYLEYLILRPAPLIEELRIELIIVPALILLIFTGFLEELIFRGIFHHFSIRNLGRRGLFYVALVFAVLHIGYQSVLDFVFVFVVALFFGYIAERTGSILGVTLAHGLTNISLFLIFPFLVGLGTSAPDSQPVYDIYFQPEDTTPIVAPFYEDVETKTPTVSPTSTPTPNPTLTLAPSSTVTGITQQLIETEPAPATATPEDQTCTPPAGWVVYIVQPGDTLYAIAQRAGVSVRELQDANCIQDATVISVGQRIYTPTLIAPPPTATNTVPPSPTNAATQAATITITQTPVSPSSTPPSSTTPTQTATPSAPPPTNTLTPTDTVTSTHTPVPTNTVTPSQTPLPTETASPDI